jgi:hypothetical protein
MNDDEVWTQIFYSSSDASSNENYCMDDNNFKGVFCYPEGKTSQIDDIFIYHLDVKRKVNSLKDVSNINDIIKLLNY